MDSNQIILLCLVFVIAVFALLYIKIKASRDKLILDISAIEKEKTAINNSLAELENRFKDVLDVEVECQDVYNKADKTKAIIREMEHNITTLQSSYSEKKAIYDKLREQVAIYDDTIELAELGFYKAQFPFDSSEKYKQAIRDSKDKQKLLVKDKSEQGAFYCTTQWTVDGSKAQGTKKTNQGIRLTARAFNNECDAAIANCKWNNVDKMAKKIEKAFDSVNKLNESNTIYISKKYLQLKLEELYLTYEYHEQRQKEKEEQAEIKAQMREDAKVEAEIKKAKDLAEKEEKQFSKALDKARKEASEATGEKLSTLEAKIAQLQSELEEAEVRKARALSMAEQTRQGHVYVISNIGSFGDEVYKIGMTRRLEPLDRVKELGDASVPFVFDVHALIHTKDAPTLEKELHAEFNNRRVNMVNKRKEFFNVSLDEIKAAVHSKLDDGVEFIETAVARDFHETKSIIQALNKTSEKAKEAFAEAI